MQNNIDKTQSGKNVLNLYHCVSTLSLCSHSVHLGINPPPSKTPPHFSCQAPPLDLQTVQAPPFRQSPLHIGFLSTPPPLKIRFFSEPQKY